MYDGYGPETPETPETPSHPVRADSSPRPPKLARLGLPSSNFPLFPCRGEPGPVSSQQIQSHRTEIQYSTLSMYYN